MQTLRSLSTFSHPIMLLASATIAAAFLITPSLAASAEPSTASGHGTIERLSPSGDPADPLKSEQVNFNPRYSFAYVDNHQATWIVLTEAKPPATEWAQSSNLDEARQLWCQNEKAAFVALKLDKNLAVDLFFHCPADGNVSTEMLSTINGLDSLVVKLESHSDTRIKGTLKGGEGNCPTAAGADSYCTTKEDFSFDAELLRLPSKPAAAK